MEPINQKTQTKSQDLSIVIASKKIQINSIDHELVQDLVNKKDKINQVTTIRIQGNSYSLDFCKQFGLILKQAKNLKYLNINDMFVSRLKQEIPKSIQYISQGLVGSNLLRLDISNNAVNPFGAQSLLIYLKQATSLQVLLIYNCGLGPMGVAKIAEGLKGTPQLKTLSIARNRMGNPGILSLAASLSHVPLLQQFFIYDNSLNQQGLQQLLKQLHTNCKKLQTLDISYNHVKKQAAVQLSVLIKQVESLKNINLNDTLKQDSNDVVIQALEKSKNRNWVKFGYNFNQLNQEQALRFLNVMKECPLKRLEITGNDFPKKIRKAYSEAINGQGVLSSFKDQDVDQVIRLFQELKI